VPSFPNQTILDLTSLSKEDIQGYGIVLKVLDGKYESECLSVWLIVLLTKVGQSWSQQHKRTQTWTVVQSLSKSKSSVELICVVVFNLKFKTI